MIDTVLFDLDGTLLPMDQDRFIEAYMSLLAKYLAPYGYEAKQMLRAIWDGTGAMVKNDGSETNETVFWDRFCQSFGADARKDEPLFEEFYASDFGHVRTVCGFAPEAAEVVALLKEKGITVALATNPLFPAIATRQRIRWAGLDHEELALVTTYEDSHFSKPNPKYYLEVLEKLGKRPEQCVMVGNDVDEDVRPAGSLGMKVFLLDGCIINKSGADLSDIPHGGFDKLKEFLLQNL